MLAASAFWTLLGLLSTVQLSNHIQGTRINEVLSAWQKDGTSLHSLLLLVEIERRRDSYLPELPAEKLRYRVKYLRKADGVFASSFAKVVAGDDGVQHDEPVLLFDGSSAWTFHPDQKVVHGHCSQTTGDLPTQEWLLQPYAAYLQCDPARLRARFLLSVPQVDKAWMWIRAVPTSDRDRRDFQVAQVCVSANDHPSLPKYFPAVVQWRGFGQIHKWTVHEVVRNDSDRVKNSDFDIKSFEAAGWKVRPEKK